MIQNIKLLLIGIFLVSTSLVTAQETESSGGSSKSIDAKNSVYLEFLGKGFYYSINYERNIYEFSDKLSVQGSIGFSLMNGYTDIEKSKDFLMPLELNLRYLLGNHSIVAGYGTTLWKYKLYDIPITSEPVQPKLKDVKEWFAHMVLEYRYQKPEGGLMLKAGWSPLFFATMKNFKYKKKTNFANSFNIGVGYAF